MKVKEGRTVRLTISNAERSVIVPDLIGSLRGVQN